MVNFEDQDWEELGAQARRGALDVANAWRIVAGLAIGMLLGGGLVYLVDHGMLQRGLSEAAQAFQRAARGAGPPGASPPKSAVTVAEPLAAQQDVPEPASTVPGSQAPPADAPAAGSAREAESAQRALQVAAQQKELAWARYYKKPAQCDGSPGRDTIVECANHFIRARREFEAAYAAGKH
jgi:hypothetical protein